MSAHKSKKPSKSVRMRAAELQQSNELLSLFITNSPIYSFIKEVTPTESRVLIASENFKDMIGIPGSEMTGKTMEELFPAEFAAKITADDWSVVFNGKILHLDEELNGRKYITIKFPIVLGGKHLMAGYTLDITERKRSEESLRKSEEKYRLLHESMMDAFVRVDMDGAIQETNRACQDMLGYSADELKQLKYFDLTPAKWHAFESQIVKEQIIPRGYSNVYEKEYRKKDGTTFPIELRTFLLRDTAGQPCGMWAIIRDITMRKYMEDQLFQAQKLEAVGRLAGGIAHDFNNKLQIILGCAEIIAESLPPDHPGQAGLQNILTAAHNSADLTSRLLAFSRKQIAQPVALNVHDAITGSLNILEELVYQNVQLHLGVPQDLWCVFMDPSQLEQILINLVDNACDAITGSGHVFIEAANRTLLAEDFQGKSDFVPPGDYVELTIRDDGAGMAPQILEHMFEPFFTTKGVGKGTGLGLATIYGIVKQNGGAITVQSVQGQGTTFTIYLPRTSPATVLPGKASDSRPRTGTETVLLVEDEEAVLHLTCRLLEQQGYKVLAASLPNLALEICEQYPESIHLLLTDVIMPDLSGKELADRVLKIRPDIRVLYMSGFTAEILQQRGHLPESLRLLRKPFTSKTLAQQVRAALDKTPLPPTHA